MIKTLNLVFLTIFLTGCISFTNPSPSIVQPSEPSFDGNSQNSGVLYQITSGGYIITKSAKERYDLLVNKYKNQFTPPLDENKGTEEVYIITDEVFENYAKLVLLEKNPDILKDVPMATKRSWWNFWKK